MLQALKDYWLEILSMTGGMVFGLAGWIWRRKEKDDSDQSEQIKKLKEQYDDLLLEVTMLKSTTMTKDEFRSISDEIMREVADQHSELRNTVESCSASISATVMTLAEKVAHLSGRMDGANPKSSYDR